MKLPFLDRHEEAARFRRLLDRAEGSLGVAYGRRRCGKSRLLREVLPAARSVYYVGDDREPALQRASLATEIGRLLPGFDRVTYPDWEALLARWWREAAPGTVLALDEFPSLIAVAQELPSLLQKHLDREGKTWGPAGRWWGPGLDRRPLEVDLVAESIDGRSLLVGEVKWSAPRDAGRLLAQLEDKARQLPPAAGRDVVTALWLQAPVDGIAADRLVTPPQVLDVLK